MSSITNHTSSSSSGLRHDESLESRDSQNPQKKIIDFDSHANHSTQSSNIPSKRRKFDYVQEEPKSKGAARKASTSDSSSKPEAYSSPAILSSSKSEAGYQPAHEIMPRHSQAAPNAAAPPASSYQQLLINTAVKKIAQELRGSAPSNSIEALKNQEKPQIFQETNHDERFRCSEKLILHICSQHEILKQLKEAQTLEQCQNISDHAIEHSNKYLKETYGMLFEMCDDLITRADNLREAGLQWEIDELQQEAVSSAPNSGVSKSSIPERSEIIRFVRDIFAHYNFVWDENEKGAQIIVEKIAKAVPIDCDLLRIMEKGLKQLPKNGQHLQDISPDNYSNSDNICWDIAAAAHLAYYVKTGKNIPEDWVCFFLATKAEDAPIYMSKMQGLKPIRSHAESQFINLQETIKSNSPFEIIKATNNIMAANLDFVKGQLSPYFNQPNFVELYTNFAKNFFQFSDEPIEAEFCRFIDLVALKHEVFINEYLKKFLYERIVVINKLSFTSSGKNVMIDRGALALMYNILTTLADQRKPQIEAAAIAKSTSMNLAEDIIAAAYLATSFQQDLPLPIDEFASVFDWIPLPYAINNIKQLKNRKALMQDPQKNAQALAEHQSAHELALKPILTLRKRSSDILSLLEGDLLQNSEPAGSARSPNLYRASEDIKERYMRDIISHLI